MQKSKIMFLAACGVMLMATSSAHALTRAEDAALKSCQMALQNNDAADRFYELDLGIGDAGKPMEIQRGIGWFMAQPDPMQAVKDWSEWMKRTYRSDEDSSQIWSDIRSQYKFNRSNYSGMGHDEAVEAYEQEIHDKVQAALATNSDHQMRQNTNRLIGEIKRGLEDALHNRAIVEQSRVLEETSRNIRFDQENAVYYDAFNKWKAHAIAQCGGELAPPQMSISAHLSCTGEKPNMNDYAGNGPLSPHVKNPEVQINTIADLLNHPAFARMSPDVQARTRADVEKALAVRAAGTGPTSISTYSSEDGGSCPKETCFSFAVYRQGESSQDVAAAQQAAKVARIAELGNAMNVPVHMRGGINGAGQLTVNITNLNDLAGVTNGAGIRKTLETCLAGAKPGSGCLVSDRNYQFFIRKD